MDAVDYNSWIDTPKSKKLVKTLDKDIVLAEGKHAAHWYDMDDYTNAAPKATRSTILAGHTWRRWATGPRTRMRRSSLTASAVSTSL